MGRGKLGETPGEALAIAAYKIAKREGLHALTARRLAAEVGGSSSAVTYHYGSMARMRREVAARAEAELSEWRSAWRLASPGLGSVTPGGFVLATVAEMAGPRRGLVVLAAELANSNDFPEFLHREREAAEDWVAHLHRLGVPPGAAVTWTDFLYGATPLACIDDNRASLLSWLPLLTRRLEDRLAGRPSFWPDVFPFPPFPESLPEPPAAAGAQRILQATIEVLGERGAERLTHRDVATRAGLSVAASTYFFETKSDMIIAAVREISRRAAGRMREHIGDRATSGTVTAPGGTLHAETRATLMLYSSVVRNPELRKVGEVLRDLRGPLALERLRLEGADADRVDGVLWATLMQGAMHPFRIPAHDLEAALEERANLHRTNLFGVLGAGRQVD